MTWISGVAAFVGREHHQVPQKCLWSARGQNEGSFPPDAPGSRWLRASHHAAGSGTRVTSLLAPPHVVAVLLQLPGKESAPRAA